MHRHKCSGIVLQWPLPTPAPGSINDVNFRDLVRSSPLLTNNLYAVVAVYFALVEPREDYDGDVGAGVGPDLSLRATSTTTVPAHPHSALALGQSWESHGLIEGLRRRELLRMRTKWCRANRTSPL